MQPRGFADEAICGFLMPLLRPKYSHMLVVEPFIYLASPADALLLDTPSALHIGASRRTVTGRYHAVHAHVQDVVFQWIRIENEVESKFSFDSGQLRAIFIFLPFALMNRSRRVLTCSPPTCSSLQIPPPDERLVPSALCAFLFGTILIRHRGLPLRMLLSPLLGTAATVQFLPRFSYNIPGCMRRRRRALL
ncbi:hypothetical protein K438DRAFT_435229 [Mycena galopus ATCC 62051]|nr:hypothetical protein K438DRAFT_435229 [Mycena galopus ATCC 62051]